MRLARLLLLLLCPVTCSAQDWGALQYLIGNWTAEGAGWPGQGAGSFSFEPGLQGTILVRKNRSEYPATKDRLAYVHEDLMIVYREMEARAEGALRAVYFDSEQHVIHYGVTMFGDRIVFTSEPESGQPQYRFTYERERPDTLKVKFEIAPPGKAFATYVEGSAKRAR